MSTYSSFGSADSPWVDLPQLKRLWSDHLFVREDSARWIAPSAVEGSTEGHACRLHTDAPWQQQQQKLPAAAATNDILAPRRSVEQFGGADTRTLH